MIPSLSRPTGRLGIAVGLALLLLNLVLFNVLAARSYLRADWTSGKVFTLSDKSIKVLRGLRRPVSVTVFMVPPGRMQESLYQETRELLRRFARHSSRVKVEFIDMDANPSRAEILAKKFNINAVDLREGVVVFAAGPRSKYVPSAKMAEYAVSPDGGRRMTAFKGEGALLSALLAVTAREDRVVCFTTGHGEADIGSYAEAGYGFIVDEVRRDSYRVRAVDAQKLLAGAKGCGVLVVGGPRRAFAQVELDAMDRYLRRGGRLFVLLGPVLDRRATRYRRVGLEATLARWGIQVLDNIVVDKLAVPGEQPLMTWATRDGYGHHPVARSMAGRLTVWPLVREVRPASGARAGLRAVAVVRTSAAGWAETDIASLRGDRPLTLDRAVDTPGPVSVAVAAQWRGSRLIVFGTERGVLNRRLGGIKIRDFNRDMFLSSLNWLAGQGSRVAVGPRIPEHIRLTLDDRQMGRVFLISVVGLPACGLFLGLFVWWRRRR